jgi:hypothetical protein
MRIPVAIIMGAALIAASVLVVGRYSVERVALGTKFVAVVGIDQWHGKPFLRKVPIAWQLRFGQYGTPVN